MNSCYLDANFLIYLDDYKSPFHNQTKSIFKRLLFKKYTLVLTPLILDEYLYNSLKLSVKPRSEAILALKRRIKNIFRLPGVKLLNPPLEFKKHFKVLNLMNKYNLRPRDAYHLLTMIENKVKYLATFDRDFKEVFQKGLVKQFS